MGKEMGTAGGKAGTVGGGYSIFCLSLYDIFPDNLMRFY